jgi:hypothetical protein
MKKKLKDLMGEFTDLRARIQEEYREVSGGGCIQHPPSRRSAVGWVGAALQLLLPPPGECLAAGHWRCCVWAAAVAGLAWLGGASWFMEPVAHARRWWGAVCTL